MLQAPVSTVAVVVLVVAAIAWDLTARRVPNWLTAGAAVSAFGIHAVTGGWPDVALAAAGWAVGLMLFFPLFALKGMGAGDLKLLAAFGAWLGPLGAIWTGLYGAVVGGVMALMLIVGRSCMGQTAQNIGAMFRTWRLHGLRPVESVTLESSVGPRLPYALPIAAGALVTLWFR